MKHFYCHVENGGLTVSLEQSDTDCPQYLTADWSHFGNIGPKASIPLLTEKQIDAMIVLLNEAKKSVKPDHSYELDDPLIYLEEED